MLRFAALGSGSRGNALLVEFGATLLMVDCGLPRKAIEERLETLERSARDVTAVLVTHEHTDHAQGVEAFARRYNTPLWMTPGTASAIRGLTRVNTLSCHRAFQIGGITVEPYPVPHDAREPCQFVFEAAGRRLGLLTDAGHVTPHMYERLAPAMRWPSSAIMISSRCSAAPIRAPSRRALPRVSVTSTTPRPPTYSIDSTGRGCNGSWGCI